MYSDECFLKHALGEHARMKASPGLLENLEFKKCRMRALPES